MQDILILHSIDCAVDKKGNVYQEWKDKKGKYGSYPLENTVVEWYDELNNYDLMVLIMWCIDNNIKLLYNFR